MEMTFAYFNGRFIDGQEPVIPIEERGHQFGDGVYEVIRFYNKKPFMMKEHLERLYGGAKAIKLTIGSEPEELEKAMLELVESSGLKNADLYMQATRGVAPRQHLFPQCSASISMTVKPSQPISEELRQQGVKVLLLEDERWKNCYIKSLNLLPNVLAKQEAYEQNCFESVLVRDGFITEGSSSNFFIVKEGSVQTAPLTNYILPGITRIAVKAIAEELAIPFIERAFTEAELVEADEAFLTSTLCEVLPVTVVNHRKVGDGKPGLITETLLAHLQDRTK
ncbi:D-amino-acid transaminase [Bacillus sp. FJAT-42315]|uniref:D-amino-acid transaminase n=1 Tax=Bacillus sp. FJAT-42315 TaxID=2014077 RepID=UPI001E5339A1|nr:D-amino-acid transaminase [Bacillus sp. FJAT-42315]